MKPIGIISYGSVSSLIPNNEWLDYQLGKSSIYFKPNAQAAIHTDNELEIKKLQAENSIYNKLDRSVLLAILACRKATHSQVVTEKLAINIGSSRGATQTTEEAFNYFLQNNTTPTLTSPNTTLGNIASWVGQDLGKKHIEISHSITCSTGLHSILNAAAWLQSGMADYFIAGASESCLTPFTFAQMNALKVYATDEIPFPCQSMNFTKSKNTMVLGEGAAVFLLQNNTENCSYIIKGYGWATESIQHAVAVSEEAKCFQESMKMALTNAELQTVDAIVMHAPGTMKGDSSELSAIKNTFQDIPFLTSNKWKIGHCFASSGSLSMEMALLMLKNQEIITNPVSSLIQKSPNQLQHIMVNAVGFGGNAVSIIVSKL